MPGRRKARRANRTSLGNSSIIVRPGQSFGNDGFYQENSVSADDLDGNKKKSVRRFTKQDEGVLYTVKVTERPPKIPSKFANLKNRFLRRRKDNPDTDMHRTSNTTRDTSSPQSRLTRSDNADETLTHMQPQQYTISKMHKPAGNWIRGCLLSFGIELKRHHEDVESYLYKPSKPLLMYINWTFYASFTAVFLSFLGIFIVLCLVFAGLFAWAGENYSECIVVSGEPYGTNPETKFGDAFALSWTTYGNVYTATGNDFESFETKHCSGVVFLCTLEAFLGLIYAGMCAAILFGKVNRVQSHAHISFANAVCLQYEEVDLNQFVDLPSSDSDCESDDVRDGVLEDERSDEHKRGADEDTPEQEPTLDMAALSRLKSKKLCNKGGGEIVDGLMKVVGIKLKRWGGKITHSQYVRVNLVDCEHPFFGRVWHGVHILDSTSPLLSDNAKQRIKENGGSWPEAWLDRPAKIRRKLDFHSLVITVAGVSNVSACTVHAYKRYKFKDVIIGFDYAPLVYENESSGKLEVDLRLANDVREQHKGSGEDLKSGTTPLDATSLHRSIFDGRGSD
ncbi:hypothetical protein ACHAXR_010015, partial [Thalassiosira sp. AJA248-18]